MKLKTTQSQETTAAGGTVIADRFKLNAAVEAPKTSGLSTAGAAIALVCSLVSIVLLGATAWMIYQNLDLIQNV